MLYLIIALVLIAIYTYTKYDTLSPKLFIKSTATLVGYTVGSTPEVVRTTTKLVKASNAKAELELRETGQEAPIGFREGTVIGKKVTRETLADFNKMADDLLKESLAKLDELNSK